jgi:AdoMet-dependent heme synthase
LDVPRPAGIVGASARSSPEFPSQPLHHLDALWIQVAGTLCNLTCTHCFVSCGPKEERHALLSRDQVRARVAEALPLGVKEFYFTGGEPFLHRELIEILADTLEHGPVTVLTNGTLLTDRRIDALARLSHAARYSLEIRVSLDGASAEEHDLIRGAGAYDRAVDGLVHLSRRGLMPIVTVTQPEGSDPIEFRERWIERLVHAGVERPRLKVLPFFRLGRESSRTRGYAPGESLAGLGEAFDPAVLPCGGCRAVTSRGVFPCPLLVDEPGARMGARLDEALGPIALSHGACFTCWVTGSTCGN